MLDKKIIQKNFSRAAKDYDEAALVQKIAAKKLTSFLDAPTSENLLRKSSADKLLILDLGSGTSFIAKTLLQQQKNLKIYEIDIAAEMLNSWPNRPSNVIPTQADIENLPFEKNFFDLIISSFSLQWISDFEKNFSQFFSLLKPNGIFAFCLPTAGSLTELKSANLFNFNQLPEIKDLKSALKKSGFHEKFFAEEIVKQEFKNGLEALKSLKKIGANYSVQQKRIITKTQLDQFNKFCLKNFGTANKNIGISWSVSYFLLQKS